MGLSDSADRATNANVNLVVTKQMRPTAPSVVVMATSLTFVSDEQKAKPWGQHNVMHQFGNVWQLLARDRHYTNRHTPKISFTTTE